MPARAAPLEQRWSSLDFGLHAFLVLNPLALGLWIFSLAPLVGGNLFVAVALAGLVSVLGAIVIGALASSRPWTGGDYAWQTRLLDARVGTVIALASWWVAVALLAPVYGNVLLVQAIDPVLAHAGWDGVGAWFRGREGAFTASLLAIAAAAAFVGLGMRRAAILQRALVVVGGIALVAVLVLLFTGSPGEFRPAFDDRSAEVYEATPLAASQIAEIGDLDASATELEPADSLRLVPLVLLFLLWVGWAGPLAGEVRTRRPDALRLALFRAAIASTLTSLLLLVAIGRGITWELWNEANNLYWGTVYGTTPATPLAAWPSPVVFATWLTDSSLLGYAVMLGMSAWILGWTATLFLPATRVLVAAASDRVLPSSLARTTGDSVPTAALAALVVPACALAALDAYWQSFASLTAIAVVALGVTTAATGVTAMLAFRRERRGLALASAVFVALVCLVIGTWVLDPVYGLRAVGPLTVLAVVYGVAVVLYVRGRGRSATPELVARDASHP